MERLDDLEAFLAIVEKGTQAAAARHLRRSLQSVNRSLAAIENAMSVQLIRRSTRRSEPTEAGLEFYNHVKPAFSKIMQARLQAASQQEHISGALTIGAPHLFATDYIAPAVCEFIDLYPRLDIELQASDEQVDLLDRNLDLAVRIGHSVDESLIARRVNSMRVVTFGALSYFAKHGKPMHPRDLVNHECVLRAAATIVDTWSFRIDGDDHPIKVQGRFRTNSATAMRAAVANGLGIGQLPYWQVRSLIEQGSAEIVLGSFEADRIPIQLAWSPARPPLERTRRFVEFLAARLKAEPF
ncbi:MAG: LysR family transcriptional regulator [Rhizobiaceae bacterium]|nr:LysR family transcriptional regulator [Rhizobiaceae bacterium]